MALCGCYPQVSPEAARQLEADLIGGSGDRRGFLDLLEQLARTREKAVALDDPFRRRVFEPLPAGGLEGRTRAMLKVEDGCTNFCAYCIIPYARGAVRSLPVEQAAAQARDLAEAGSRGLSCPPMAGTCRNGPAWPRSLPRFAGRCPGCGCGWGPWSPGR